MKHTHTHTTSLCQSNPCKRFYLRNIWTHCCKRIHIVVVRESSITESVPLLGTCRLSCVFGKGRVMGFTFSRSLLPDCNLNDIPANGLDICVTFPNLKSLLSAWENILLHMDGKCHIMNRELRVFVFPGLQMCHQSL